MRAVAYDVAVIGAGHNGLVAAAYLARAVGLGWFDRLGGAAIGAAEGAIAAGALLFVIGGVLGREHALLTTSRSFAMLQRAEHIAELRQPDVAAAPVQP